MKVSELQGAALDWAVAKCEGGEFFVSGGKIFIPDWEGIDDPYHYRPSVSYEDGGPIIEREGMHVDCLRQGEKPIWEAWPYATGTKHIQQGPSPLIAAMRCYVASQLGDEIELPEGL